MIGCLVCIVAIASPGGVQWKSAATNTVIEGRIHSPRGATSRPIPTVVYLRNLAIDRIGQESDDAIISDLLDAGNLVLVLDYGGHAKAVSPELNADVLKIREDIAGKTKTLLADLPVDSNRLFIIPEGFRLRRDVEFARDGKRVLAMDVIHPSKPKKPVPALMEITCDNQNRMGSGSLLFCRDTLLEGAALAGFAAAMVDHPVPPPYKGIDDPMPESIHRVKAAVRTLRAMSGELGLDGNIGVMGFSRGGPMAALLAVTGHHSDLEGDGPHRDVSSRVQAAMLHGNRYDYLQLRDDDPMLRRFEKAWGPRDANADRWAMHGASFYLTKDAAPMFLNTSDTESPEFRDGLANFAMRLKETGVEHVHQVDEDGRGHRVSTDSKTLAATYRFFARHLRGQ